MSQIELAGTTLCHKNNVFFPTMLEDLALDLELRRPAFCIDEL